MLTLSQQKVAIYVDRSAQQWVVRDESGNFWILPMTDEAWEQREPYSPTEDCELEPVPGHYKYLLGLSF